MASYEEIHGKRVETFSSDPTLDSSYEGQVWFNSTSGTLKTVVTSDAFISGTPIPTAKSTWHRAGTMTAGLFCAGNASTGFTTSTEEWNGLGFSQGGAIGTALYVNTGFGTQTAGASAAGRPTNPSSGDTNATFEYDGSTWTSVNAANLAARTRQSFGVQTAGAMVGGFQQTTSAYTNATEEYDGTNWTTVTAAPTNLSGSTCMGTQTAAIVGVGGAPTNVVTMLAYDGTNWTSSPSMNNARSAAAAGGTGATNTAGLVFGGSPYSPTASATAERWDGTSFTNSPASLSTARIGAGISDGSTNGIILGGYQGTAFQSAVEEFNSSFNTFTAAAWASGGNMPASYYGFSAFAGTQTAGIALGGKTPPGDQATILKYDGTSWSANPSNLNTARRSGASVGTQTATLLSGGVTGGSTFKNEVEEFDGSSASAQNTLPYSGSSNFGFGTQTAAVVAGGYAPPFPTLASTNVEYDGTNWTAATALPAARGLGGSAGMAQTTGLVWAGLSPSVVDTTLEYDGTNWTAGGTYGESKSNIQGWGDQTSAIGAGGEPGDSTNTFVYDGTTWATQPSLPGARKQSGSGGADATAGLIFGGETPPITNTTIEFTGETTAVNASTLTTG